MNHFIKSIGIASALCCTLLANAADEFPDGTTIYGYRTSGGDAYFFELSQTEPTELWADPGYKSSYFTKLNTGWISDGKYIGYRPDNFGKSLYGLDFVEIDWETGELIQSKKLSTKNGFFKYAALNSSTATIYGYGYNADKQLVFMSAPLDAPDSFTVIKEVEEKDICYGITWNKTESVLAGMLADGTLVTIATDGTQTEILKTNFTTSSSGVDSYSRAQPLVWSEAEKVYYWNAEGRDLESSYLWKINPETNSVGEIWSYEGGMFDFLMAGEVKSQTAPVAPEIIAFDFTDGANSGTVTVKMPAKAKNGTDLSGTLTWKASVDGTLVTTGEAAPGEEITVSFTDIATGMHAFGFLASVGDDEGASVIVNHFIGMDTPTAPSNVVLTLTSLTWEPVTTGVNGGYISPSLEYEVYLNGEKTGTTTDTNFAVNLPTSGNLYSVSAQVYAASGDLRSAPGISNSVTAGSAYVPPIELLPTAEEALLFSTIDGYDDGSTWTFNAADGRFQSGYNPTQEMNEWLVLPPVELQGGERYTFSFKTSRIRSFFDEEYLEVGFGSENTAASLGADIIISKFQVPYTPYDFETITTEVEVTETGIYYFGLHAISSADMGNIFVNNFSIVKVGDEIQKEERPGMVTDFTVTPSADFMSMTLSWNAPFEGYEGGYINPENLTYTVRILKETAIGALWDDVATGLKETSYVFTTKDETLDYYSFAVIAVNSAGASPEICENGGVLGVPYSLPISDDFSSANWYDYEPWITYMPTSEYYTRWGVLPLESVPGIYDATLGRALCGQGLENGCLGMAGFPVISTEGCNNAILSVKMWTGENAAPTIFISGEAYGMTDAVNVGNVVADGESDWQTFSFELPKELLDQHWVKLYLNAEFPDGTAQWVVMSDYQLSTTAGIADEPVTGDITITTSANTLTVECPAAAAVEVYNISGALVTKSEPATSHNISLGKGIYMVHAGTSTFKVAIY